VARLDYAWCTPNLGHASRQLSFIRGATPGIRRNRGDRSHWYCSDFRNDDTTCDFLDRDISLSDLRRCSTIRTAKPDCKKFRKCVLKSDLAGDNSCGAIRTVAFSANGAGGIDADSRLFFTPIYRRFPNLWAVGLAHGLLGALAFYLVLGEDPGADILQHLKNL